MTNTKTWSIVTFSAIASLNVPAFAGTNLVINGDFEISNGIGGNTTGLGHIDKGVTLPGWTKTCLLQCGGIQNQATSYGFAFVVDDTIATRPGGGVTAFINDSTETLYFWGPNNSVSNSNNAFAGSANGGKFVAIDGDFGRSKLSQTISGLDTSRDS